MPVPILMPALSPTMESGLIAKWLVQEGDRVQIGQPILLIETDKASMEVEAVEDGILGRIDQQAGEELVAVNQTVGWLLLEGETNSSIDRTSDKATDPAGPAGPGLEAPSTASASPVPSPPAEPEPPEEAPEEAQHATVRMPVRQALRDAMAEEMRRDPKVFLMGEEVAQYEGAYKISQGLLAEFGPKRVVDTPITEHGFAGLGVGAALAGLRPIVEFMTFNFAMQALDQIINSAAKTHYMSGGALTCPIVFRGPNGAAARVAAQHSQCFASWYAHCPGLVVLAPWSGADAKGLLKAAIRSPNPVIFLEHELLYGAQFDVPTDTEWTLPLGRSHIEKEGTDVTLITYSIMVGKALTAAEQLAEKGIQAEVINLRSLRPLDLETILTSVRKTNRAVTIEEGWAFAGIGAELVSLIQEHAFDWLDAPVMRVAGADVPLPYAANLERAALPQPEAIVAAVSEVCYLD